MAADTGRDDFIISIRSAFLKKGTRQKFSLFTLLLISIAVLSLEYFKTGPVNQFRSITKDIIYTSSYYISSPFIYIEEKIELFKSHLDVYQNYVTQRDNKDEILGLKKELEFYIIENQKLKEIIEEKNLASENYLLTRVLLDKESPYLKSIILNKGFNHGVKIGSGVKEKYYFVGKVVEVNYLSSRILLASDLNSKIPVIIQPGRTSAILSGRGNNEYAELDYLPKNNQLKTGDIVYTSGSDGMIKEGIPVGKVFVLNDQKLVSFFVDFDQLTYVRVNQ
tara:strand:- start:654 stop:1490 length:837 start_codon:yes stop_codon:yes gene_type:complete